MKQTTDAKYRATVRLQKVFEWKGFRFPFTFVCNTFVRRQVILQMKSIRQHYSRRSACTGCKTLQCHLIFEIAIKSSLNPAKIYLILYVDSSLCHNIFIHTLKREKKKIKNVAATLRKQCLTLFACIRYELLRNFSSRQRFERRLHHCFQNFYRRIVAT